MIKIYKLKAKESINTDKLRVTQTYRFTPNKEYIGRYTQFNTMLIYDDIGNGIEFEGLMRCSFRTGEKCSNVFNVIDCWEVKNKRELRNEILKLNKKYHF